MIFISTKVSSSFAKTLNAFLTSTEVYPSKSSSKILRNSSKFISYLYLNKFLITFYFYSSFILKSIIFKIFSNPSMSILLFGF